MFANSGTATDTDTNMDTDTDESWSVKLTQIRNESQVLMKKKA